MSQQPIVVSFRLDAATREDALAAIDAIREAGIAIVPHHTHRPKRRDEGVFWDGHIVVGASATSVQAAATRLSPDPQRSTSVEALGRRRLPRGRQ